ncbi:hypothetical protein BKA70DRAFT_384151 [Coprinopsis sp. MPI-PUGE-AT-0042]|nr:hypothetical protein BKA70DRAFT_384151 [Coprinopsis sp. MPI-PUGE-AT-0042]
MGGFTGKSSLRGQRRAVEVMGESPANNTGKERRNVHFASPLAEYQILSPPPSSMELYDPNSMDATGDHCHWTSAPDSHNYAFSGRVSSPFPYGNPTMPNPSPISPLGDSTNTYGLSQPWIPIDWSRQVFPPVAATCQPSTPLLQDSRDLYPEEALEKSHCMYRRLNNDFTSHILESTDVYVRQPSPTLNLEDHAGEWIGFRDGWPADSTHASDVSLSPTQ